MKKIILSLFVAASVMSTSCGDSKESDKKKEEPKKEAGPKTDETSEKTEISRDPHSFSNPHEVGTKHIHLKMNVDFDNKVINGIAKLTLIHHDNKGRFVFDANGIDIQKVIVDGEEVETKVIGQDELLGMGYEVVIGKETEFVEIHYKTTERSEALQWLNPEQTAGKVHPYLFTQGQAVLTRTWIPCQDSPVQRITYSAEVSCPDELMAVMSASNKTMKNDNGDYLFEMKQTIPSYLMALAVGDLRFAEIGPRTGVYTEPALLEKSRKEFEDMEKMLIEAEGLYGEYKWDRYDVIVLPPSFPYGGMENPRLTFATPTILAGDKSLVALIAHEMAHSWSGNLVTNATWDDFWLNEGFTVYFENRIMEEVYGKDYADMLMMLSEQDLKGEIEFMFSDKYEDGDSTDTYLKLNTANRNPEVGLTAIAYDKGAFFLKMLEHTYGRETFDAFLKSYFDEHQFQTMTTDRFLTYLDKNLISKSDKKVNVDEWVFGLGLPSSHIPITSNKFTEVEAQMADYKSGKPATEIATNAKEWTYQQTLHFVRLIDEEISVAQMAELDAAFGFTQSGNSEILSEWILRSIKRGYDKVDARMEAFLMTVGRAKFLVPMYQTLKENGKVERAKEIYAKARKNYHSVAYGRIDKLLEYKG